MSSIFLTSFFVVVLAFLQFGHCGLNEFQMDREVKLLARATSHIIRQVYTKHSPAMSLIPLALKPHTYYKMKECMNRILLHTESSIAFVIEQPKYMKYSPFLRDKAIIWVDGYEAFT